MFAEHIVCIFAPKRARCPISGDILRKIPPKTLKVSQNSGHL